MSETVSRDEEVQQEDAMAAGGEARLSGRSRRAVATVLVLAVLAAGAGVAWSAGVFRSHGSSGTGPGAPPPATQPVAREDLSSQVPLTATLGYAGSYTVPGQGGGTLTWLPPAGPAREPPNTTDLRGLGIARRADLAGILHISWWAAHAAAPGAPAGRRHDRRVERQPGHRIQPWKGTHWND